MSRKQQRLTREHFTAEIEKFSHDGRGIARIDGKTTFIQGALPGEVISFQYTRKKKDFDEGRAITVQSPAELRAEPRCPHYSLCGGCSLQHLNEQVQINIKENLLLDSLQRIGHTEPQTILKPLISNYWNYRNKARLSVRFVEKKNSALVGFREQNNPRYIAEINQCSILNSKVDTHIPLLRKLIDSFEFPHCIAQIEVAAGDDDIALMFRNLETLSPQDAETLKTFAQETGFIVFLQPGNASTVTLFYPLDREEYLSYSLPKEGITFKFHPTDFTQINSGLNQLMVSQAMDLMELKQTDRVLDLFCGLGNFSLPLAKRCGEVVGVEGSQAMVLRATMNAQLNNINNVKFYCADLEKIGEFNQFIQGDFNKLLIDPPRSGALEIVKQMDQLGPERIVYISCNPATLARDSDILVNQKGYIMHAAGVMDMFPHTTHVESIAVFEKG